jgi:hypothetical protein
MKSEDLLRSPIWSRMASAIARDFRAGVPFEQIHEMNIAMKQGTLEPYRKHRRALDALLWYDDPGPKKIIELGAGYGGMRSFWPEGSTVYNVDLPEMLEIQEGYIKGLGVVDGTITTAVPFTEADSIDFSGAYLFSTWALTETTFETWDYYIERAAALAGAYVVGWRGFKDIPDQVWPWERLRDAFKTVRSDLTPYLDYDGDPTDSLELAAVNR